MPRSGKRPLLLKAVVLVCFTFIAFSSFSQIEPSNLIQYTEANGLPSSQIYTLMTDRFGYVWIGTINGLARFDGHEFTRFYSNPEDTTAFKGLNVWFIYEDTKGRLWISSGPSYLNMYDPATRIFKQYDYVSLIEHPANVEPGISTINEDASGRLFFGVNTNYSEPINHGLLYYNEKLDKIERIEAEVGNMLSSTRDHKGNLWFLGMKGLFSINQNLMPENTGLPVNKSDYGNETFIQVGSDKEGNLWMLSNRTRILRYNPATSDYQIYTPYETKDVSFSYPNMALDKDGILWFGTNKGLMYFETKKGLYGTLSETINQTLAIYGILSLNFDSFGSLWIGTFSGGLFRYDGKSLFDSYSFNQAKNSITPGWANNIYEAGDSKVWVTTTGQANEGGINSINLKTGKVKVYPFRLLSDHHYIIFAVYEVSPHEFYVSTNDGIYSFDDRNPRLSNRINLPGIADSVYIHHFHKDKRGILWLCTFDGLYKKAPGEDTFTSYQLNHLEGANAASNEITYLYETDKGIWLLTNNGLFFYDYLNDKIERHGFNKQADNIFISQDINSFYIDKSGIAWVGSWQGGLSRYDIENGTIKTYTMNNGLPSMSVQGILGDELNNQLWISTFEGLCQFNIKTEEFSNFAIADGLPSQLFADASCLRTRNGLFVFGSSNGITVIDASEVKTNIRPPKVFLTDLKLNDKSILPGENSILKKPVNETEEVIFRYNQNTFTIEFNAIHFKNPSRNRTAYILENYDNQWREIGNQHFAFYSNLPPGEYIFRVKAANNNGVWNKDGPKLKIIIKPPWWYTTWAFIAYAILIVFLIYLADRYFKGRIIKKEREYARARELEHAREIEKAYRELKTTQTQLIQSEKMASLGELTAGIAHEIKNPLNFVNNFSELNTELIDEMIEEMKSGDLTSSLNKAQNIRENEEKIKIHGKRADSIIKGMLQHSRVSGIRETIDINTLAEEYLRLAYHGMRAKEKSFNTTLITDFDDTVGTMEIIPQEIGRVILNLLTNAFYSVMEKKKKFNDNYEPMVTLSTAKNGNIIEIRISDNGNGIPEQILDKIFVPFFTTKPAGEGTGLGLSMSYDIVTKGHGGELKVETQAGEGAEFKILLPQKKV